MEAEAQRPNSNNESPGSESKHASEPGIFTWDIYLYPPDDTSFESEPGGHPYQVSASLDTFCTIGNWISGGLIRRLGMEDTVDKDFEAPDLSDFNGSKVECVGTIALRWKVCPDGTTLYDPVEFYVFSNSNDIDLIFGREYIVAESLLVSNKDHMLPLTPHKKKKDISEEVKQRLLEEEQRQGKTRVAANAQQFQQQGECSGPQQSDEDQAAAEQQEVQDQAGVELPQVQDQTAPKPPQVHRPSVQPPTVRIPELQTPQVQSSRVQVPLVQGPHVRTPQV